MINKREGSTLLMVISVVAILSVLVLGLFMIAVTDKKQVVQQDKNIQTYYLARSGADTVAEYIIKHPFDFSAVNNNISTPYVGIGNGSIIVTVTQPIVDEDITIDSTGTYDNQSTDVKLTLKKIKIDHAIFSNKDLDVNGMNIINGDIGSNGSITEDKIKSHTGDSFEYMDLEIPSKIFPTLPLAPGDINTNTDYLYDHGSLEFDNISIANPSGVNTFDTGGGDLEIIVDDFYFKGDISIIGGGRVILYIGTFANIQTPSSPTNDADELIVYLAPNAIINLSTPFGFNGHIIAPEGVVNMSSNSTLTGSVIADEFYGTSNTNVIYDAPADGYLVGGYTRKIWE